jgi:PIN domain nuclease of toxin-antitoxin system
VGRTVKLLLDTHTLLWWWSDDRRLSATACQLIRNDRSSIFVSAATAWEVATKKRIGRLPELQGTIDGFLPFLERQGFGLLDVTAKHAVRAGSYEMTHGDPFDRLLAAQSEIEGLPLVTRDSAFSAFPCKTRW